MSRAPEAGAGPEFLEPADPHRRSPHYAQAVRVGARVLTSGQGGWSAPGQVPADLGQEVAQAFDNVAGVLAAGGLGWAQVRSVTCYHVGPEVPAVAARELRRRTERRPQWHNEPVPMLGEAMHIEVAVVAEAYGCGDVDGCGEADDGAASPGAVLRTAVHQGREDSGALPDTEAREIDRAFQAVEADLDRRGFTWAQVIGIESWHQRLDLEVFELMVAQLRRRIPGHHPIWTCVGADHQEVRHTVAATVFDPQGPVDPQGPG